MDKHITSVQVSQVSKCSSAQKTIRTVQRAQHFSYLDGLSIVPKRNRSGGFHSNDLRQRDSTAAGDGGNGVISRVPASSHQLHGVAGRQDRRQIRTHRRQRRASVGDGARGHL